MDEKFFPVKERLFQGLDLGVSDFLLVDGGGGRGHDLEKFRKTFVNVPGRLILQDLPGVIENIEDLDTSIGRVAHDFTAPQPVYDTRAYFLHSILHDWSDEESVLILQYMSKAMRKGCSRILIH